MEMDEALSSELKVIWPSESTLSIIRPPCSVSNFGRTRLLILDRLSTEKEPLISSILLKVMVPLAEDEIVTLPSIVSQLVRLFTSF